MTRTEKRMILEQYHYVLQELEQLEEMADPIKGNRPGAGIPSGKISDQTATTAIQRVLNTNRAQPLLRFIEKIDAAVQELPYAQVRTAVRWRYLDGKTVAETGDLMGFSTSNVKKWAALGLELIDLENIHVPGR